MRAIGGRCDEGRLVSMASLRRSESSIQSLEGRRMEKAYFALTSMHALVLKSVARLVLALWLGLGVHQMALAAVITFQDAPSGSIASHAESGFTVTAFSGSWFVSGYGNPGPSIQFEQVTGQPALTSSVRISSGGSLFQFGSVDLYSSVTPIPYVITGYLNSVAVFSLKGTVPNTFGTFATVPNPSETGAVDALSISLTNPEIPCCSNPMGLDNIRLSLVSPVPEPDAYVLLLLGLLAVVWRSRRDVLSWGVSTTGT